MALFKGLKQKRRFGYLLIWLASGVLLSIYYLFVHVPEKEQALHARYFRVLNRIGQNLNDRLENYQQQAESYSHTLYANVDSSFRNEKSTVDTLKFKFIDSAKDWQQERENKLGNELGFVTIKDFNSNEFVTNSIKITDSIKITTSLFLEPKKFKEGGKKITVEFGTGIDLFFNNLLRPDAFDHFLVFEQPNNSDGFKVIYSTFPIPPLINKVKNDLPYWLQDTSGIQTTRVSQVSIQGKPYQLFLQPITILQKGNYDREGNLKKNSWLIAGAVPSQDIKRNAKVIPGHILEALTALMLFAILALPFLKLILIKPAERLYRRDFYLIGIALLMGTSLYIVLSATQFTRSKVDRDLLDYQLKNIGKSVQLELNKELFNLSALLHKSENWLELNKYQEKKYKELGIENYLLAKNDNVFVNQILSESQPEIDYIMWLNQQGKPLLRWDYKMRVPFKDLSHRIYFIQAKHKPTLTLPSHQQLSISLAYKNLNSDKIPSSSYLNNFNSAVLTIPSKTYGFESIISYSGGELVGVLSQKSNSLMGDQTPSVSTNGELDFSIFKTDSRNKPAIQTIAATFNSFDKAILPDGYRFCLIDGKGEVLFHSDKNLNLSENILQDCEPAGLLRAAMDSYLPESGEIMYQGQLHRARILPLISNTTVNKSPYYIVVFAEKSPWVSRQMHVASITMFFVFGFQLILLLLASTLQVISSRVKASNNLPRMAFDWCWVSHNQKNHYTLLAIIGLNIVVLIFFMASPEQPLRTFSLLLLGAIYFYLLNFILLQKDLPLDEISFQNAWQKTLAIAVKRIKNDARIKRVFILGWAAIVIINCIICYWLLKKSNFLSEFWQWFFNFGFFQLLLIVIFIGFSSLYKTNVIRNNKLLCYITPKKAPRAYAYLVMVWLLILSMLPAYFGYQSADIYERKLQASSLNQSARKKISELGSSDSKLYNDYIILPATASKEEVVFFWWNDIVVSMKKKLLGSEIKIVEKEPTFRRLLKNLHFSSPATQHKFALKINPGIKMELPESKKLLGIWEINSESFFIWFLLAVLDLLLLLLCVFYIILFALKHLMVSDLTIEAKPKEIQNNQGQLKSSFKLIINPHGSTLKDLSLLEPTLFNTNYEGTFNLGRLKEEVLSENFSGAPFTLLFIEEFEYRAHTANYLAIKVKLLQILLDLHEKQVVIISAINPKDFNNLPKTTDSLPEEQDPLKAEHYKQLYNEMMALLKNANIFFIPVSKSLIQDIESSKLIYQYNYLWDNLTIHEKFFLYDLAQDGIVNAKNNLVMEGLLEKCLIEKRNGRLYIFEEQFRLFILSYTKSEIQQYEEFNKEESEWQNLEGPIILGILAIAGFMFLTQREAFNTFNTLLLSLSGLLPLLPRFLTILSSSKAKANG